MLRSSPAFASCAIRMVRWTRRTDAANRPITFSRACADALGGQIDNALSPDEWIARLATLPLIDQPGAGFHYGQSNDLLGFIIARVEGVSLGEVL